VFTYKKIAMFKFAKNLVQMDQNQKCNSRSRKLLLRHLDCKTLFYVSNTNKDFHILPWNYIAKAKNATTQSTTFFLISNVCFRNSMRTVFFCYTIVNNIHVFIIYIYIYTIYTRLATCLMSIPRISLRDKVTLRLLKLYILHSRCGRVV
jgi:hypothetical protein